MNIRCENLPFSDFCQLLGLNDSNESYHYQRHYSLCKAIFRSICIMSRKNYLCLNLQSIQPFLMRPEFVRAASSRVSLLRTMSNLKWFQGFCQWVGQNKFYSQYSTPFLFRSVSHPTSSQIKDSVQKNWKNLKILLDNKDPSVLFGHLASCYFLQ